MSSMTWRFLLLPKPHERNEASTIALRRQPRDTESRCPFDVRNGLGKEEPIFAEYPF